MIGFFDIKNGCAGDMVCGAIAGCVDVKKILEQLKNIDFPTKYEIEIKQVIKPAKNFHGIKANQFLVHIHGKEHDRSYTEIISVFEKSKLPEKIKEKIIKVFNILADAESKVHNTSLNNLHFHAVGQTDALVEISFAIVALEYLGITRVFSSPAGISNTAPATLEMLKGMPVIIRDIPFEIATPTGIAIIKALSESFTDIPVIIPEGYSYGTGTANLATPNTLQFIYGKESVNFKEKISVIETSIDDMNPVIFEYLIEKLYQAGALEVCFFTGVTKKSRPMFWLRVLCNPIKKDSIFQLIFTETSTLGIRYREEDRLILKRVKKQIKTKYGTINVKLGYLGDSVVNVMPEYEDCKKIALEKNVPLKKIIEEAIKASTGNTTGNKL